MTPHAIALINAWVLAQHAAWIATWQIGPLLFADLLYQRDMR